MHEADSTGQSHAPVAATTQPVCEAPQQIGDWLKIVDRDATRC
jgi:hypothetical protein